MVEIPTIVSMRTIAVFVNIVRLLSFLITRNTPLFLLTWTIFITLKSVGISDFRVQRYDILCAHTIFSPYFFHLTPNFLILLKNRAFFSFSYKVFFVFVFFSYLLPAVEGIPLWKCKEKNKNVFIFLAFLIT